MKKKEKGKIRKLKPDTRHLNIYCIGLCFQGSSPEMFSQ